MTDIIINLPKVPVQQLPSVSAFTALRALPSVGLVSGEDYAVDGSDAFGDGGGGLFVWVPSSTATDDDATVIKPADLGPLQAGRWLLSGGRQLAAAMAAAEAYTDAAIGAFGSSSGATLVNYSHNNRGVHGNISWKLTETASVTDPPFNATADGTANDYAAINAAKATGRQLVFPAGTYKIGTSITLANVMLLVGAVLKPAAGVVITLDGALNAPLAKIFDTSLGGTIVIAASSCIIARPEWWGAITDNADAGVMTANLAALNAAIVASPITELTSADYFISSTLKMTTPHRILRGIGKHWSAAGDSTRIIIMSPTADAIQMGPDTYPGGGIAGFLQEIHIHDMSIVRGPPVTGTATYKTCPAGIRMQYCLFSSVYKVWSTEHSIGILMAGVIQCRVREVFSFRSIAGSDPAHDPFFGFFYDGSANDGLAGGNASVYETDCNSIVGGAPALTISSHSYGQLGYIDWFIERPESTTTQYGIVLDGTGAGVVNTQDIHIAFAVFDQCTVSGIKILNSGNYTIINITDPYIALNTGSTTGSGAIDIEACTGLIDIDGGQILGGLATTGDVGVKVNNSSGVNIRGTLIREAKAPIEVSGSSNCNIAPRINNPTVAATAAGAVSLSGTNTRITLSPQVVGGAGLFPAGVDMAGTGSQKCTVDVSAIDPAACAAAAKIKYNSAAVVAVGAFGTTNLAQGNFN